MKEDEFNLVKGFKSYVSKPEITDLGPQFLVKGSKNVLIDYASRIISRNGYKLYRQANNGGSGIKSGKLWNTSTGKQFDIRVYDGKIEFDWNGKYNLLKAGFFSSQFEFEKVWDNTEKIDVLLGVCGDSNMYKWSGGVTKLRSTTGTALTKQGVLTAVNTIAFTAGNKTDPNNPIAATIVDGAANFLNAGFAPGDTLYVTGSTANSRTFTILSVTASIITLIMSDTLTTEAAGQTITIHNGEPTWASSRFLLSGSRTLVYNGVEYSYTGGETTDTLTGLTAFPTITVGDPVWQGMVTLPNPAAIPPTFKADFIGVEANQIVLGSSKSAEIYGSKTSEYTNFALTSPRLPGDPFKLTLDGYVTCIVPTDRLDTSISSIMIGSGISDFFKITFSLSNDTLSENVKVIKQKTGSGAGLISRAAIVAIKNATAYISREPTLDTLGVIENQDGPRNIPLSDLIKNDFDNYNFINSHVQYFRRAIYIALPAIGIVLIYDLQRQLWQPPQTMPISRFTVIQDKLYGHSSITNETYELFVGTDDNGVFIPQVARFAYNNGGRRDRLKNMNAYWTDGYITPNGLLTMNMYYGFEGINGKKSMSINGSDQNVTNPVSSAHAGTETLGSTPLGGSVLESTTTLPGTNAPFVRFWQEDTLALIDYPEHFVEYTMNTLGGQFAIVSHGSDQFDAGTSPVTHKK